MFKSTSVGIDIGTAAVKIVELTRSGRRVHVTGAARVPVTEADLTGAGKEKLARTLQQKFREAGMGAHSVVLGVPQKSGMLSPIHLPKADPYRTAKMVQYEIEQMSERIGSGTTSDFKVLRTPDESEEQCVLIGMARNEELFENYGLMEMARFSVKHSTISPMALFNTFKQSGGGDPEEWTLLANIGRSFTDLVIVFRNEMVFARSVGFGGNQFTQAIASAMQMDPAAAETAKIDRGTLEVPSGAEAPDLLQMAQALRGQAAQLASTLTSTLKFASTQLKLPPIPINRVFLSGGAAQLRGLKPFLEKELRRPVEFLDPFRGMQTDTLSGSIRDLPTDLAVAAGLAYVGIHDHRAFFLDLLPVEVKRRREFMTKNLFLYVAAAAMLFCFGMTWLYQHSLASAKEREFSERQTFKTQLNGRIGRYMQLAAEAAALDRDYRVAASHMDNGDVDALPRFLEAMAVKLGEFPSVTLERIQGGTDSEKPAGSTTTNAAPLLKPYILIVGSARDTRVKKGSDIYREFNAFLAAAAGSPDAVQVLPSNKPNSDPTELNFSLKVYYLASDGRS